MVKGSAVKKIVSFLRSKTINDLDAMFLMNGSTRFYEGWPHVFGLSMDAFTGPGLHGRKAMDEVEAGTIPDPKKAHAKEPDTVVLSEERDKTPVRSKDDTVGTDLSATGSAGLIRSDQPPAKFDLGDIDPKGVISHAPIRSHITDQRAFDVSRKGTFRSERHQAALEPEPSLEEQKAAGH